MALGTRRRHPTKHAGPRLPPQSQLRGSYWTKTLRAHARRLTTTAVAICRFRTTCAPGRAARSASARPACPNEGGVPPRPSGATTTSTMSRRYRADRRHAEHVGTYSRSHPPPSTGPQAKSDAPVRGSITDQPMKKTYKDSRSIHTLVLTRTCVPVLCYSERQETAASGGTVVGWHGRYVTWAS